MAWSVRWLRDPPLAALNVIHGGRRSLAAISGVGFSLMMVLLQLGFLEAVRITAAHNFEQMDFDVVLVSPRYEQFYAAGSFPKDRLNQARNVPGVTSAAPLLATFTLWRCPEYPVRRPGEPAPEAEAPPGAVERWLLGARVPRPLQRRELFVLGIDPERNPFEPPLRGLIDGSREALNLKDHVLLNEESHPDFGWQIRDQVSHWELGNTAVTLAGGFPMLRGFAADSTVICTDLNFRRACLYPPGQLSLGFLKVRGDSGAVRDALKAYLPPDVVPMTRAEILDREIDHWVNQTSTGQLFAFGVLVAMAVAAVVVYQVLSNDVREHLPEYATLKAMGYSAARLGRVVVEQSLIYMLVAYVLAVVLGAVVYRATEELAGIPMRLTAANLMIALALAVAVGFCSGLLSVTKLRGAQPADLF